MLLVLFERVSDQHHEDSSDQADRLPSQLALFHAVMPCVAMWIIEDKGSLLEGNTMLRDILRVLAFLRSCVRPT